MIISLLQKHGLHPDRAIFVGDSIKDVAAGHAAGVFTVLLKRPYNAETQAEFTVDTLREILDLVTFSEDHK
jgi:phosphoglycolate phosphatase-like HAD superfamily hydrolase